MKYKIMDGNEASTLISYLFTEVAGIYPITPSSAMAELTDSWAASGKLNYFGNPVKVVEMQSEAGAAGMIHGSLQAGCLTSTYTASQGLLLMIPNMYKIAGEQLPLVINVAARSLVTHALSIFGDHQDIYATRATGFAILSSSSPQQAHDLTGVSYLSAIKGRVPFINFFDGFRTSHELDKIELIDTDKLKSLIDQDALDKFRNNALTINNVTRGTAQNDDIYFQMTEVRNEYYDKLPDIVSDYLKEINKITGRDYRPFNYYGSENAKNIIVAMGSVNEAIREVVDARGDVGLIEVHLYRPFSDKYFLDVLPDSVEVVCVLDRTKEAGSGGEPLYKDVSLVLSKLKRDIKVYGGRYGLSSKNTTPSMINGIYEAMEKNTIFDSFTIGILDDVTNLSLKEVPITIKGVNKEILVYGYGSDGMVSASKDIMKIVGDETDQYVQGYFQYDSKKSGGVTISHLRFSDDVIHSTYYVEHADVLVCTKDSYLKKFDMISKIKENGTFVLNTNKDIDDILTNKDKKILKDKNIKVYVVDANSLSNEVGLSNKISSIMESVIFKYAGLISYDIAISKMRENLTNKFSRKGNNVLEKNLEALNRSNDLVFNYDLSNLSISELDDSRDNDFISMLNQARGNELPVSSFKNISDGTFPGGLSQVEKRGISSVAPCFIKENCITCGMCSLVCPHAVIRPFLLDSDEVSNAPDIVKDNLINDVNNKDLKFIVSPSIKDCTGCNLCVNVCPGKGGNKALQMVDVKELEDMGKLDEVDYLFNEVSYKEVLPRTTIKGSQLRKPRFSFSGACSGCGETPYLKLMTQLFGDNLVVANATGCSSIYSSSIPTTAYDIPWSNSLFEDNAEYGFGMKIADDVMKDKIKSIIVKYKDILGNDLVDSYVDNVTLENSQELLNKIEEVNIDELNELKKFIPKKTFFIVGGDGWAYDIGFSGIDHVLSNNLDVNILVLDTEVYSNTGGQSSKSSKTGSVSKFAAKGKENAKKDLLKIALTYPHVYVGAISMGANMNQAIKVMNDAASYDGPSIIVAYSPCISQGILKGMDNSIKEEKLAVEAGYFPIFHYDPRVNKFSLDAKVDFTKYREFLDGEDRYRMLKIVNPNRYEELMELNKQHAIERYSYYEKLANQEKGEE